MKISRCISTLVSIFFTLYNRVLYKSKFQDNQYRRSDIVLETNSFKNRFREFTDRSQMPSYNQIFNVILYFVIQVTFLPFIFWQIQTLLKRDHPTNYFCIYFFRFRHYYQHVVFLRWLKPSRNLNSVGLILASTFGMEVAAHLGK